MRIGLLTGGGDCSGLNAAIRAVVGKALEYGYQVFGIPDGWAGVLNGEGRPLSWEVVEDILREGGTILGTSRTNPAKVPGGYEKALHNIRVMGLNALIVIGGDDTLSVAAELACRGVPCIGIPKTMDNDVPGTDYTIGFDTAVSVAMDAIERVISTSRSHKRVMFVEVMGREAGWVALYAGLAAGAHLILIPEVPLSIEEICSLIEKRRREGTTCTVAVVAEGFQTKDGQIDPLAGSREVDAFGHVKLGGVAEMLAAEVRRRTGVHVRTTILGYIQRGGPPTVSDRVLATRMGVRAVELVKEGLTGLMVAVRGGDITSIPLAEIAGKQRLVPPELYWSMLPLMGLPTRLCG